MGRDEREGPSELLNMAVVATATHAAKTMVINVTLHAAGSARPAAVNQNLNLSSCLRGDFSRT